MYVPQNDLTRIRNLDTTTQHLGYWNPCSSGDTVTQIGRVGEQLSTWDVVTAHYRKRVAAGEIIMNPFYQKRKQFSFGDGIFASYAVGNPGCIDRGHGAWYTYIGYSNNFTSLPEPNSAYLTAQALYDCEVEACTKVLSEIGRSPADNWQNLAEVEKTVAMIAHPLASFSAFHRRNKGIAAGMSAANAWLMYRYGIRPLISDIDATLNELKRKVRPLRKSTHASSSVTASGMQDTGWDSGGHHYRYRIQNTETYSVHATSIDNVVFDGLNMAGLSPKSLMTLPWELVRYSFVVDWFLNIGDFLGAIAQSLYPSSLGTCYTTVYDKSEVRFTTSHTVDSNIVLLSPYFCSSSNRSVTKNRKRGLRAPEVVIKQNFRLDDIQRIADGVSLVGQIISGFFGGR